MTRYEIVPANFAHVASLAENMSDSDRAEVWAAYRHEPEEALLRSIEATEEPLAGLADGECMCIFGVAKTSFLSDKGSPWMLGHKDLPKHSIAFLRMNKKYMERISGEYDKLVNFVDARNKHSIRWLKWLGFTICEAAPFGVERMPFHRFELVRENAGANEEYVPVGAGTTGLQEAGVR